MWRPGPSAHGRGLSRPRAPSGPRPGAGGDSAGQVRLGQALGGHSPPVGARGVSSGVGTVADKAESHSAHRPGPQYQTRHPRPADMHTRAHTRAAHRPLLSETPQKCRAIHPGPQAPSEQGGHGGWAEAAARHPCLQGACGGLRRAGHGGGGRQQVPEESNWRRHKR